MTWFFMALGCAFLTACCDSISKRIMETNDEWVTGTVLPGIAAIFLAPVFWAQHPKPITMELLALLAVAVPLEVLAYYLFLSAIRMAPLSLTVPLLAFTPALTIGTSAMLLGEGICASSVCGIALVTFGAYILNGDLAHKSLLAPIRALVSDPGSRRMLLVALIWSITSALGKKGVLLYGAIPFGMVLLVGLVLIFALIAGIRGNSPVLRVDISAPALGFFVLGGAFMAGAEATHFVSLSQAPVACMIAVKRLSLVFGVLMGWLWFQEDHIRYRLIGGAIMVSGVFLIYH
jgi:drug/metabolite transporter (DMT)-like permease